ncbi:VOC family protein [Corynebacterium marquesiae]|uniref:VOC family protein n=1 Tax=Corynebacterium marquesiae TaxID=2913503 RepID=UPI00254EB49C|nr:VOC family protein [Corynebacterium marquesiae]MDK8455125.1 VOC family protein [Corynebacterium marquesiae]MDK8725242.1 VOC family protein [Corynebacterium marquesiae]MDK8770562.1 VOC family protein [Corynebacterium marquesiae]
MYIASVPVDGVARAHDFYVNTLSFRVKDDVTHGAFRWLTVTNAEGEGNTELLLEPKGHPAAKDYAAALKADGIPVTQFLSADVETEYKELSDKGAKFTMEPTDVGPSIIAVFEDTVGNLIQLVELKR